MLTYRLFLGNSDSSPTLECLHAHLPDAVMQLNSCINTEWSGILSSGKIDRLFCQCSDDTFQQNTELHGIPCFIMCCVYRTGQSLSIFLKHLNASVSSSVCLNW